MIRSAAQIGTQWLVSCRSYSASGKLLKAWGPAQTAADTSCPAAAATLMPVTDTPTTTWTDWCASPRTSAGEGGNRITDTAYHLDDTVQSVRRAVGSTVAQTYATYTYTDNGLVASVKDAKNNLTAYAYDGHDRKVKLSLPGSEYGQHGLQHRLRAVRLGRQRQNLTSLRKRSDQSITLAYDNLNRLTARSYPTTADNVAYTYDLLGRRSGHRRHGGRQRGLRLGQRGSPEQHTANGRTLSPTRLTRPAYTPDLAGRRGTSPPYDALNRPTVIGERQRQPVATPTMT